LRVRMRCLGDPGKTDSHTGRSPCLRLSLDLSELCSWRGANRMIEAQGLHKRFGGQVALDEVDFLVPRGEIFGFVGPNGAAKATRTRTLATRAVPDAGTATVGGISVTADPEGVRELIGYMPDFFGVYDRLTAEEYLQFYAACHAVPHRRRRAVAHE